MALLAEELVEEWLNRQGFFTIRGLKLGTSEMDLLAIKPNATGFHCRHVEVQASINPISYISPLPRELQKSTGMGAFSARKRTQEQLEASVANWITKKFRQERKIKTRKSLCNSEWNEELVVHTFKFPEELDLIKEHGIKIYRLNDVISDLLQRKTGGYVAAGADFVNLILRPVAERQSE